MKQKNTACGLILLFVFFTVSVSCTNRGEKPAPEQKQQSRALSPDSRELLALLPENNAIPGWTREPEVRFFTPDNLFEYIDGAAESYLIYGFEKVVTAEYSNPQKPSQAVVEVYRMKDSRNAFGIYAAELNPDSEFRQIGVEGYIGGTALNFWSGPYYAKITVFQKDDDLKQEMVKFAAFLSEKMGDPGSAPPEINNLPAGDQIPHSVRYLPKDVLGQTYLKEGFEAKYRRGKIESKLVIAASRDGDTAKGALAEYRKFIASGGEVFRDLTSPGDGGFLGRDGYYGNMAAIRSGNRLIISLGGPSTDYALSQVTATLQKR